MENLMRCLCCGRALPLAAFDQCEPRSCLRRARVDRWIEKNIGAAAASPQSFSSYVVEQFYGEKQHVQCGD